MENNIFKNPSSADLDFIEEIVTKYGLEDQFLMYLDEDEKNLITNSSSTHQKGIYKSLFKYNFPYTQKLWEEIFLIINNKLPLALVAKDFEKRSGLPADICGLIAQDITNNETIKNEISAIQIEEDVPKNSDYNDFPETEAELQEMKDAETIAKIKGKIENDGVKNSEEKGSGLGQEFF